MKKYLLIFIPLTFIGYFIRMSEVLMFFMTCLSIIPLAGYLGEANEEIAVYTGPKLGGFLNATFGNSTEMIISFFALKKGMLEVVESSLAGAVLGNILLVLGGSIFLGGLKHKNLEFDARQGSFTTTMLMFAIIALAIPAVFFMSNAIPASEISKNYKSFSITVSIILLVMYIIGMIYSFKTQADLYGVEHAEDFECRYGLLTNILILSACTILIAIESELLVDNIKPMTQELKIPELFVGLILIPIVGNAAENSTAVLMALKNKMDIAIEISVGSSLQIAMFVLPFLVLSSMFFTPMSIIFKPIELFVFGASVLIANQIVSSGKANWVEGIKLLAVYVIIAAGFFIVK
ncbi:MAG: calcium/proton exchanger [Clostridia bacterium]|nr:calcium/proton exchanger [Clostridia bacterium]